MSDMGGRSACSGLALDSTALQGKREAVLVLASHWPCHGTRAPGNAYSILKAQCKLGHSLPQIESICCSPIPIPLLAEEEDVCMLLMDVWGYGGLMLALCLCHKRKLKAQEGPAPGRLCNIVGSHCSHSYLLEVGTTTRSDVLLGKLQSHAALSTQVAEGIPVCQGCAKKTRNEL